MAQRDENIFEQLESDLELTFENWMPEVGESKSGRIYSISTEEYPPYGPSPVIRFVDKAGAGHIFRAFPQVAKDKLREEQPRVGDYIGFKRLEDKVSKKNNKPYTGWNIRVIRDAASMIQPLPPEWAAIAANPDVDEADVIEVLGEE